MHVVNTSAAKAAPSARRYRELAGVLAIVILPLLALSDRAYNVDEPLFVWLAEQIARAPLDFFGFDVNWYGTAQPMYAVTRNPPGVGYALAAIGMLAGWSERAFHLAFVIPAAVCTFATWALARHFDRRGVEAALLLVASPVFLLCANTVMSDVPMLALWLLALWAWLRGARGDTGQSIGWLWLAGGFAALAVWTKYFAIALVPLLAVHALVARLPARRFVPPLLLPIAALAALEVTMIALYGVGAVEQAIAEALHVEGIERPSTVRQLVEGLAFAGGCVAPAVLLVPWLWGRRATAAVIAAAVGVAALAPMSLAWLGLPVADAASEGLTLASRSYALQLAVMVSGGISLVALALAELRAGRDADRWLLALWLLGTLAFAAGVNWTNNGRSNLPLAPVAAILIVRRLAARGHVFGQPGLAAAAVACAGLTLALAVADRSWSNGVRDAAGTLVERHGRADQLWFHGHWGLQYYLERAGATPVDWREDVIGAGELLIVANNNAEMHHPSREAASVVDVLEVVEPRWVHTQAKPSGVSFNASNLGSLPFLLGPAAPDRYRVYRARRPIRYDRWFGWSQRAAAAPDGG